MQILLKNIGGYKTTVKPILRHISGSNFLHKYAPWFSGLPHPYFYGDTSLTSLRIRTYHTDKETPNLSTFCRFWAPYEVKFGATGQLSLLNKISSKLVQFYHSSVYLSFQGSIFRFYFIRKHSFEVYEKIKSQKLKEISSG